MNITVTSVEVDNSSIEAALSIGVTIEYYFTIEAPISISGILRTSDGKTIAYLNEVQLRPQDPINLAINDKITRDKIYESGNRYKQYYQTSFIAPLSKIAIGHIETIREKDSDRAAKFYFNFVLKFLEVSPEAWGITNSQNAVSLLRFHTTTCWTEFLIKQSDWVNKYTALLDIGNFLLLELKIPDRFEGNDAWADLHKRVVLRLKEMQDAIRNGNWESVMTKARQFYENLKFDLRFANQEEFKNTLKRAFMKDQHGEEGFEDIHKGITNLFNYTSKFIHDKDRAGTLNSVPISTKEDAFFVFALAVGLMNLISKKLSNI